MERDHHSTFSPARPRRRSEDFMQRFAPTRENYARAAPHVAPPSWGAAFFLPAEYAFSNA